MTTANTDPGLKQTAERYLGMARNAHRDFWCGDRKVFLAAIVDVENADEMELLDECRRAGLLRFARADFVQGMDIEIVEASEWKLDIATFHFLQVAP